MKVRVSDLIGTALNWAVAKCEGYAPVRDQPLGYLYHDGEDGWYDPSADWAQGGPIIEREEISVMHFRTQAYVGWSASPYDHYVELQRELGETPLIAAMRAYVASKLGDEIELPEELR